MNVRQMVAEIEDALRHHDRERCTVMRRHLLDTAASSTAAEQTQVVEELLPTLSEHDAELASYFATLAGTIVEKEADPRGLAAALRQPLLRALRDAKPFVDRIREAPQSSADDAEFVGYKKLSRETLAAIRYANPQAAEAYWSLDTWYIPAVATWSRAPDVLAERQADSELTQAITALNGWSLGAHWLQLLLGSTVAEPFILIFPELPVAFEMTLHGVSHCGQLMVLLSHTLPRSLRRIHASGPASEAVHSTLLGDGPQEQAGSYLADFRLYPWQALNPETNLPDDARFTWVAPAGHGDDSLPADYQPLAIEPLEERRILLVVGPHAPGVHVERLLPASRMFQWLQASLSDVRSLHAAEVSWWLGAIRMALG